MLAYTGIETVSNLAEEARDPVRSIPNAIRLVAAAVFAIYFTLPLIALSAMPVRLVDGEYETVLGLPPPEGFANDPVLGVVDNLGVSGALLTGLEIYVGILAATILFIATNAGVIGASRITYAMASYRQLPGSSGGFIRVSRHRGSHCSSSPGSSRSRSSCPGRRTFSALSTPSAPPLSFTVAHAAVIAPRVRHRDEELVVSRATEPSAARHRLAALRPLRWSRHRALLARDRRPGTDDPLVRSGVALARPGALRGLPTRFVRRR